MTAFCERLAACSVKFTKLLAEKSSDGSGNRQNGSTLTGTTVSFAVDNNSSSTLDSTAGGRPTSLAEALQACGSNDIVYASKPVASPHREDHDWGMKAWNDRPGNASRPAESDVRSPGLRSRSANDISSYTGPEKGGPSQRGRARSRIHKQAWSPSAIASTGWENES